MRIAWQRDRSDRHQNPQLGRADAKRRHLEHASRRRRQEHLAGDEQIRDQHRQRDHRIHVAGTGKTAEQQRRADEVEHVIDVVAVSRPLDAAHAGERAVEAVAKPVERERHDHEPRGPRVPAQQRVAAPGQHHRAKRKTRQVIGMHPPRHPLREPDEQLFFAVRKQASVLTNMFHTYPPPPNV